MTVHVHRVIATNAARENHVLWHDRDPLGMDGAQVRVFKESDEVGFTRFLQSQNGRALETNVRLVVLSNFANKTLEGRHANEQVRALLVLANLAEGDGARAVAVGLFNPTGRRRMLLVGLERGQNLPGGLASGRLAGGLLGASHGVFTCGWKGMYTFPDELFSQTLSCGKF